MYRVAFEASNYFNGIGNTTQKKRTIWNILRDAMNFHSLNFPRVYLSKGSTHMKIEPFSISPIRWRELCMQFGEENETWSVERDGNYIVLHRNYIHQKKASIDRITIMKLEFLYSYSEDFFHHSYRCICIWNGEFMNITLFRLTFHHPIRRTIYWILLQFENFLH